MRIALAATLALVAGSANAAGPGDRDFVDGLLSRLTLERAAFAACADPESRGWLESSWTRELAGAVELLRQNGFPADFVEAAPKRFALADATPVFASDEAKTRYCAVLGDWKRRWELFYVPSPEAEVRKVLAR